MKKNIDLLNGPILSSLTRLAVPIMATALVQMAYNLTDMAWIGRVGANAVAAVGSASMYTWLSQGVVALSKMGGQVKVAHSLGEGRTDEAAEYAKGAIQMGIVSGILYGVICLLWTKQLIGFFGLSDPGIIAEAEVYLKITCGAIIFSFMNAILTGMMTATGDSQTPLKANCIGLVINMVLDPVLIFGIGPFPAMGVVGAAVATVAAQFIVMVVFILCVKGDPVLFSRVHILKKTSFYHIRTIVKIGLPNAVQNMIYTSISMILTRMIAGWGDTAVAVQRVGGQIESISWMTADGFAASINSFIGQNYGAKKYKRVNKGYMTAIQLMVVWGLFTTALLVFLPEPIFKLFILEPEVVPTGVDYLRILGYTELFMCIEITTVGALSGLGKTMLASVISITLTSARIPLAIILPSLGMGLDGIWWAFSISSFVKGIVFFISYLYVSKKMPKEEAVAV